MFRAHQKQLLEIVKQMKRGAGRWNKIIAHVTPGGGKSALPVIAAAELIPGIAQKICWVVPRVALQQQAEEAFLDPNFRRLLGHKHLIRVSTNEPNPARGLSGYATSYAALTIDKQKLNAAEFSRFRYILVLDEPHHLAEESSGMNAVKPLIEKAALTLFMSGTLERGRKERIAFLPYFTQGDALEISLRDSSSTKIITYSRPDGLAERAIIPLRCTYLDAKAKWKDRKGNLKEVSSLREFKKLAKEALMTALATEYAYELLDTAMADWLQIKKSNPRSKLLIVAATQKLAKLYAQHVERKHGREVGIATMDEGSGALKAIHRFKRMGTDKTDILATVAMAYEGLDVKPITHIACLTRIRSKPWIEQMIARATRFDPEAGPWERQEAHVFMPDDMMMHTIIDAITREQAPFAKKKYDFEGGEGGGARDLFGDLIPVGSGAFGKRSKRVDNIPVSSAPAEMELTPSQKEAMLRDTIENTVRDYAVRKRLSFKLVNMKILRRFGKARSAMNLNEL
ncbi:MAG TPA: DEAD/DEAH box helicase family protein, partial [Planctomycetota bacterium]|nr:DEAD/DEAH box helicase family protein [Planctomycetota bacterium]